MAKWGTDQTIKFLNRYFMHNCLWDYNDEEYKNRTARSDALQDLATFMDLENFDVYAAKNKIHSIRNTYMNELTKIARRKPSKLGYNTKLPWFNLADNFLRKIVKKKDAHSKLVLFDQTSNNFPLPPLDKDIIENTSISTSTARTNTRSFSSQRKTSQLPSTYLLLGSNNCPSDSANSSASKTKKRKLDGDDLSCLDKTIATLRKISNSANWEDEFDAFARSIAMQMKSLPLEEGIELQAEIQNLVVQKRLLVFRKKHALDTTETPSVSPSPQQVSHTPTKDDSNGSDIESASE